MVCLIFYFSAKLKSVTSNQEMLHMLINGDSFEQQLQDYKKNQMVQSGIILWYLLYVLVFLVLFCLLTTA